MLPPKLWPCVLFPAKGKMCAFVLSLFIIHRSLTARCASAELLHPHRLYSRLLPPKQAPCLIHLWEILALLL